MNSWGAHQSAVRAMLHHWACQNPFGAEVFSTAMYIRDRTPTKALDGRTRYEILKKRAPTVGWSTSISGVHVVPRGGLAKLARCGRSLRFLSTSANRCYFKSYVLILKRA